MARIESVLRSKPIAEKEKDDGVAGGGYAVAESQEASMGQGTVAS